MTDIPDAVDLAAVREQALHWFTRTCLGSLTEDEARECAAWRAAHPAHDRCFREWQGAWDSAALLSDDEVRGLTTPAETRAPMGWSRRRWLLGTSGACAAAMGSAWAYCWMMLPLSQEWQTGKGERRQVSLPDGSVLDLNIDTRVQVTYRDACRHVRLQHGEALVSARADAHRPFVVEADDMMVTHQTDGRFSIRCTPDGVTVAVMAGELAWSQGPWWRRQQAQLKPHRVYRSAPEGLQWLPEERSEDTVAWQRGRLVFRDRSLAQVASELNRYLDQPVLIDDAHVASLRISGTVGLDEPGALLEALPAMVPVRVVRLQDGRARIVPVSG